MKRTLRAFAPAPGAAIVAMMLAVASDGHAQNPAPPAAAVAPAAATPTMRAGVAAIVDDEVISTYDLRQRIIWLALNTGVQPTQENLPALQREALLSLIDQKLEAHEIARQESQRKLAPGTLMASDKDVNDEITRTARSNNMTSDQFLAELVRRGVDVAAYREQVKIQRSWNDWIFGYYRNRVRVSDDQVDKVMREIAASATKPSYEISEIFIDAARAGGVDAAVNLGRQLIGQLQQNAPFEALARQYSSLPTAAQGGYAGWMSAGELDQPIEQALENLRPGQVTEPIRTTDGAYVILLRDKRAGAASSMVNLKQVAVNLPASATEAEAQAAQAKLLQVKAKVSGGCNGLEAAAQGVQGVQVADLGQAETKDLAPAFREAVEKLQPNQVSDPVRTGVGMHLIALCSRSAVGAELPERDEVENRLFLSELSMIQRRELRNLRASAVISQPQ